MVQKAGLPAAPLEAMGVDMDKGGAMGDWVRLAEGTVKLVVVVLLATGPEAQKALQAAVLMGRAAS